MEGPGNAQTMRAPREMSLRVVGVVRKPDDGAPAELVIDTQLGGILDGIEGFSHLLVLYWAHLIPPEERSRTKVHPMGRKDLPPRGIFATRSPARPNPLCLTPVRLLARRENTLLVEGLDALDGSPLVDIKPYVPESRPADDVKLPDWWHR